MARRYRVVMPLAFAQAGDEVSADEHPSIDLRALAAGGFVEEITQAVPCPACTESPNVKKGDVPKFQKAETLEEHYRLEHPGLAAPDFEEVV